MKYYIVIPAHNEQDLIGLTLQSLVSQTVLPSKVVVVNDNSTDKTAEIASSNGASVVFEPRRGYGSACLCAISYLKNKNYPDPIDLVVFLDADHSDNPSDIHAILKPFDDKKVELVIGSRVLGESETDALLLHQRFGNLLATMLIRLFYGVHFTDLGPFRAIRWNTLLALNMEDIDFVERGFPSPYINKPSQELIDKYLHKK